MDFKYTYSAPTEEERLEIESIKRQYEPKEKSETKLDKLRNLDKKVKIFPLILSLTFGIVGTLVFGLGLTLVLEWNRIILGILVATLGLIPISIAYPTYSIIYRKNKEKYADEIIKLSDELLNEKGEKN